MNEDEGLTASEVAELLGVKQQTVYAYVSRGILHRRVALDGRTSRFDRADVEQLRLGRRRDQAGELRTILTTRLTRVADDGLWVRGRDLIELVRSGAGLPNVADLLWDSPDDEAWPAIEALGNTPLLLQTSLQDESAVLLDTLRAIVANVSAADPLRHDLSKRSVRAAGRRTVLAMSTELPIRHRLEIGDESDRAAPPKIDAFLWRRLSDRSATAPQHRALDMALALLADHGLAGSTFAARIAASVRADPYSVISAGLGVLGGPLHGAASAAVHKLYVDIEQRADVAAAVGACQRDNGAVPGFGHLVYREQDPRYGALMSQVVEAWVDDPRLQHVYRVRDLVSERSAAIPNVDLALGALTYLGGMPPHAGEVIFAIARTTGWLAHAMEEYEEQPLRFRPVARYLGPSPSADG